jgi:uroporphyrin-III C-methyltransferase
MHTFHSTPFPRCLHAYDRVFTGGEEVLEYRKYGIEAIIAPGLSSSYAAPLSANIPITHRGIANQVVICTGYGQNGVTVDVPEYRADRTVVLLMAVGNNNIL